MKTEERHKLQQNELADWLGRILTVIKPYTNAILAVALLVVVIVALSSWWNRQSASEASGAWEQIYRALGANNPAQLDKIVEDNPGTEVAQWAAALSGDIHLAAGCQQLFTNKSTASQDLQKAVDSYTKVGDEARLSTLRERATFGLARAYEATCGTRQSQGELQKAIKNYEELVKNWPDGAYAPLAKNRLDQLKSPAAKRFYDKFAQFDPQPSFTAPAGVGPSFDSKSLQEPKAPADGADIKFPNLGKDLGKGDKKPAAGGPSASPPKTPVKPPELPPSPPPAEKPGEAKK